jgi:hypothetical protein
MPIAPSQEALFQMFLRAGLFKLWVFNGSSPLASSDSLDGVEWSHKAHTKLRDLRPSLMHTVALLGSGNSVFLTRPYPAKLRAGTIDRASQRGISVVLARLSEEGSH